MLKKLVYIPPLLSWCPYTVMKSISFLLTDHFIHVKEIIVCNCVTLQSNQIFGDIWSTLLVDFIYIFLNIIIRVLLVKMEAYNCSRGSFVELIVSINQGWASLLIPDLKPNQVLIISIINFGCCCGHNMRDEFISF